MEENFKKVLKDIIENELDDDYLVEKLYIHMVEHGDLEGHISNIIFNDKEFKDKIFNFIVNEDIIINCMINILIENIHELRDDLLYKIAYNIHKSLDITFEK